MKGKKVLIIGLDGATWKLIEPWLKEGKLLTFRNLMQRGVYGVLESTVPSISVPAIPSFYTGKNPGKLGLFHFIKPNGRLVSFKDIKDEKVWDLLGRNGHKSCIYNLTCTYPPFIENGVMVSGVLAPSKDSRYTYPKELKKQIRHKRVLGRENVRNMIREKRVTLSELVEITWNEFEFFEELMGGNEFDFALFWVLGTDIIQHACWNDKDIMLKFYEEIDKILDRIQKRFKEFNKILMSDHGFEGVSRYNVHINEFLRRKGYLKIKGGSLGEIFFMKMSELFNFADQHFKLWKYLDLALRTEEEEENTEVDMQVLPLYRNPGIDYRLSVACLNQSWGIKIIRRNLKRDYEEVREEIISEIKEFKDTHGRKVVRNAWKREEIFNGSFLDQIPDIVFLPTENFSVLRSITGKLFTKRKNIGEIEGTHFHARDGIFIAWGPEIEETGEKLSGLKIYDIAPTILHIFEVAVPSDMDGRVLMEIFRKDSASATRRVKYEKIEEKEKIRRIVRELKLRGKI